MSKSSRSSSSDKRVHRTCLTCRQKSDQSSLIRFHVQSEQIIPFGHQGRSGYTCDSFPCFTGALQPKVLSRAFRNRLTLKPLSSEEQWMLFNHLRRTSGLAPIDSAIPTHAN